jgi:folate-dependent phosphoribosylglycinamide formyltransferase PurN
MKKGNRDHDIHYVNEDYDEGGVIFKKIILTGSESAKT